MTSALAEGEAGEVVDELEEAKKTRDEALKLVGNGHANCVPRTRVEELAAELENLASFLDSDPTAALAYRQAAIRCRELIGK